MPLKRYEIRNEYSLADPELYKAADKDDPEAILEGVAMAGLVGVLRQLGDLAEFAAEIFHDLHEEVMTTASRGHGLIVRVQQLEAEFPLIERKLLSQTSHTSFLYNPGVDWRSNLRLEQNTVTQGDLPRFVMDSYEECRGPPRLFLLDKFDVAGAGACLKRFTDPSFFKTEYASSADRKLEAQREKKTRRLKKRGPRWRNGETPESFPSSHAKLHQLFLEERIESGGNDPDRHVKLKKRQFTGSLFDQEKTKSYMETFLDTCPPEQRIVHEIIDPLALTWTSNNASESGLEIVEIGTVSPLKESIEYGQGFSSSPDVGKNLEKPPVDEVHGRKMTVCIDSEAVDNCSSYDGNISSTITQVVGGDNFAARESKSGVDIDDWHETDDIASEIDDYVDALAVIESEVETDSECKKYSSYLSPRPYLVDSDGSLEQPVLRGKYVDSQSVSSSSTSGHTNSLTGERKNSSRGNSVISLSEDTSEFDAVVAADPSIPASISDNENTFSDHRFRTEEITGSKTENHEMASMVDFKANGVPEAGQDFESVPDSSRLQDAKVCSTENYTAFGGRDVGHAIVASSLVDFPGKADSGHRSSDYSIHEKGRISDVYSDTLVDAQYTSDPLQIESHNAHSVCSSFEEHSKDMDQTDVDACSDSTSSLKQPSISGSECPEANTKHRFSALVTGNGFNIQDKHSETMHCTPSPDVLATLGSIKDPICGVASYPIEHGQRVSNGKIMDDLEPSSSIDCLKSEDELQKLQSEINDAAVSEHCQTEASELHPGNQTILEGDSLSFGTVGRNATDNMLERNDAGQDFVTTCPDQTKAVEMIAHLDDRQTNVLDVEATNDKIKDETDVFSDDAILCDIPSKHSNEPGFVKVAENDPDLGAHVKHLEPVESLSYNSMPTNCKDGHDTTDDRLSPIVHPEMFQDQPLSVSADCYHDRDNNVDLRRHDLVESLPPSEEALDTVSKVTSLYEHGASLASNNRDNDAQTSDYVERDNHIDATAGYNQCEPFVPQLPPQSSEHKPEDITESCDSGVIIGANHELVQERQLVYPPEFPVLSTSPSDHLTNLEPPALPPLPPMQWRLSKFQNPSSTPERQLVHQRAPQVQLQPTSLPGQTARLPTVYHTPAPVQPIAVPVGHYTIAPAPQTTLPTLAPVAPMILPAHQLQTVTTAHPSWNEGQPGSSNGFVALNGVTMPVVPALSEGFSHSGMNAVGKQEHLIFSVPPTGYMPLQGGFTLPMQSTVSEGTSHDNPLFTPLAATGSQSGSQLFGNFHQPNVTPPNPETSYGGLPERNLPVVDAKESTGLGASVELPVPSLTGQEAVNSSAQFLSTSMVRQPAAGFVASEAERTWLSTYEGNQNHAGVNTNGSFQKKLPRPRNPLIDEVVAIDKSKFRKVERVKPSLESKADEIESRLEQMQLRKVEKTKAPRETNVLEGGYVLEHLQLRKVAERVKPPVERKSEESEFLPEQLQLKKVGKKYKTDSEPKAEETESPRVRLRKASERIKQENEARTEETESPRVQLRKVGDRVKQEIEARIEETGSPQVQLRKVQTQSVVESKTEERNSLFEQIKNKSFNLKPAVAARPNIQGPRTNLKVAAILEKASNIRQAMVGSDEDDDADTWE